MINTSEQVHSFTINNDEKYPSLIWTLLMHPGIYIGLFGMIFALCIGVFCFKRFFIRPATPKHQPYSLLSLQHAIVDDDVEVAPIYRCGGIVKNPRRPHKNQDLCIE